VLPELLFLIPLAIRVAKLSKEASNDLICDDSLVRHLTTNVFSLRLSHLWLETWNKQVAFTPVDDQRRRCCIYNVNKYFRTRTQLRRLFEEITKVATATRFFVDSCNNEEEGRHTYQSRRSMLIWRNPINHGCHTQNHQNTLHCTTLPLSPASTWRRDDAT